MNVFQSSLSSFVKEDGLVSRPPERAPHLFRVRFPIFEVQTKTDRCKPNGDFKRLHDVYALFPPSLVPSNTYSLPICSYFRYSLNLLRNQKLLHFHKGFKKLDSSKKRQGSNSINEVKAA